ncbi:MAG: response regulator transcription factor [Dehalococcoidia bacterium]
MGSALAVDRALLYTVAMQAENDHRAAGAVVRVLIVDDHPPFAWGLRELLTKEPDLEPVGMASSGEEAVRLARELHPDVVVMDVSMAGMNGIEATRAIKAEQPGTAVLVLSAHGHHPYVIAALDAGAGGYLLKTVPMRELIGAIRALPAGEAVLEKSVAARLFSSASHSFKGEAESPDLTQRELQVLRLSVRGMSNKEIGQELGLAERTVQAHFSSIFSRLGVGSRMEAVLQAIKQGWITPEELP